MSRMGGPTEETLVIGVEKAPGVEEEGMQEEEAEEEDEEEEEEVPPPAERTQCDRRIPGRPISPLSCASRRIKVSIWSSMWWAARMHCELLR